MSSKPQQSELTAQLTIAQKYSKYKLKSQTQTIENTCNTVQGKILEPMVHQQFLQEFYTNNIEKGILIYHGVGSGKTYSSILMAYSALNNGLVDNVVVMLPAALKLNFLSHVKDKLDKFTLVSYNTDTVRKNVTSNEELGSFKVKLTPRTLVIIDEVQNLISMATNRSKIGIYLYKELLKSRSRIIALSATPIINSGYEYIVLFNLLKPGSFKLDEKSFMEQYYNETEIPQERQDEFYNKIKGLVSYYQGANEESEVYPTKTIHIEYLEFKEIQSIFYQSAEFQDVEDFTKKNKVLSEQDLFEQMINKKLSVSTFKTYARQSCNYTVTPDDIADLPEYSIKFASILQRIKTSPGPVMVYSCYVQRCLLKFEEILESQGIPVLKWIGGQADNERKDILVKFNSVQNMYGKLFKVILLSSAGSEGISLKNVRQVHIMEPHWNEIRIQQIIGRAIRVCSHAKLPKEERHVDIYRYICKKSSGETADEIVYNVSMRKFKYDKAIQDLVKASALDCELNLERNVDVTACK